MRVFAIAALALSVGCGGVRDGASAASDAGGSVGATEASPASRAAGRLPLGVVRAGWGDEEILRGTFEVPEDRELGTGRRISLNVIVIPALAEDPEPDPIFDLDGGPGMPSTQAARWYATEVPFRRTRDIVLVDLRGMGESNPLHCDMVGDPGILQNHLNEMYPPDRVQACREELEKRADLTKYTTADAMADLEDVRAWLGYESINFLALSYGARAAYVYARAHPERVRSMILMGPADLELKMPLHHASWAEMAFDQLCADCRMDPACDAAFPELETNLRTLVDRLRTEPAVVSYVHPQLDVPASVTIRAEIFVESLRSALYHVSSRREVPWIVHHAYLGDFGPFLDHALPRDLDAPPRLAEGAYLSITGAEDAPFIREDEAAALTAGTLLGDYRVVQQRRAARLWPRGRLPPGFFDKAVLNVPTLIVQGGRDPVARSGRDLGIYRNVQEVVVPHAPHLVDGLSNMECLHALLQSFLRTVNPQGLEAPCLDDMMPPPFKVAPEAEEGSMRQ
jgi:pimeloyl-ACP methyl ester carboxylesterase